MKNFIDVEDLDKIENKIIIDVTSGDGENRGYDIYKKGHLKGAFFMDVDEDLAGQATEETGNHPLPSKEKFKSKLESFGANDHSAFIIYDKGDNATAPRLWFLLKYFSVKNVYVINGGMKAITTGKIELSLEQPKSIKGSLHLIERPELIASYQEVLDNAKNPKKEVALIDSRAKERYLGNIEPLYSKAGHIPGARSYQFVDNYNEEGKLKPLEELESRFCDLRGKDIMVSCGSGITACSNLIVLDELGIGARLYNGSYSQWLKKDQDVTTEDQTSDTYYK